MERRLFGVVITLVLLIFMFGGITVAIFGQGIFEPVLQAFGLDFLPSSVAQIIAWPVALLLLLVGLNVLYHFGPAERGRWRWIAPGSMAAVAGILPLSRGLSMFIAQDFYQISWLKFSSLGMFLVILLWMFFMGLAVVISGEINSVSDRRAGRTGPPTDDGR